MSSRANEGSAFSPITRQMLIPQAKCALGVTLEFFPQTDSPPMKIALAQLNPTVGDFAGNSAKILEFARACQQARRRPGCFFRALPVRLLAAGPDRASAISWSETKGNWPAWPSICRSPRSSDMPPAQPDQRAKRAANAAALLANGDIEFVQHKMLLPTYDVFDESRYFQPAAIAECLSVWRPESGHHHLRRHLERQNVLGQAALRTRPRRRTCRQGRRACSSIFPALPTQSISARCGSTCCAPLRKSHGLPVIYVNQVGGNDSLVFDGDSVVVLPDGRIAAQASSFVEDLVIFDTETRSGELAPATRERDRTCPAGPHLRHARLRLQIRLPESCRGPQRRHRFLRRCCHCRGSPGPRKCARRLHARPLFLRRQPLGRPKAGREPGN